MNSIQRHRIVFYSKEDMSAPNNLKKAEELLNSYTGNESFSINDLLEIYNIKLYFDHDLYFLNWTEEIKSKYKEIVEKIFNKCIEKEFNIK